MSGSSVDWRLEKDVEKEIQVLESKKGNFPEIPENLLELDLSAYEENMTARLPLIGIIETYFKVEIQERD